MNSLSLNVDLNFQQLLEVVKQLSPSEKLKLNEAIWDNDTEILMEHQYLVNESKSNPNRIFDSDEIKN